MTDEDIRNLDGPERENFDERTWAAVAYARARTIQDDSDESAEILIVLERHYAPYERAGIDGMIVLMNFMNRFFNTFMRPLKRRRPMR